MNRITMANLENLVDRINKKLNRPMEPWSKDENGKLKSNAGNFHLSGAYGGWCLDEMAEGVGTNDPLRTGYCSKRELYNNMKSFLEGVIASKKNN